MRKGGELAEMLKKLRAARGLSLRQVEKKTGISNAYLSQLENGKIDHPSPHTLHKLAEAYETKYEDLMKLAGYLQKKSGEKTKDNIVSDVAFSVIEELNPEEKEEVLRFIGYLRTKRRGD